MNININIKNTNYNINDNLMTYSQNNESVIQIQESNNSLFKTIIEKPPIDAFLNVSSD